MATSTAKPPKRTLLNDSDSDSDDGGAAVQDSTFKVNEEYARRFEYNKKREERQRLEEKYNKGKNGGNDNEDDDDSSSSDETEDEEGFLATEDLDAQISATLQAIRSKDPRVYDKKVTFYQGGEENGDAKLKEKKEKPVYLQDYHREKLMRGDAGASDDEDEAVAPPTTYAQEQDALQKTIISQMHASGDGDDSDADSDDFVVKRKEPEKVDSNGLHPARAKSVKTKPDLDVQTADRDPETFLSNFMASRAWVPEEGSRWEAFESDDGDSEDDMAEAFEQAYNMRFEDPEKSNEVLKSYSRDLAASRSVRREDKSGRKRRRELEREKKEAERRERKEEKARLRKLKLEEAEEKLQKVKQAAGATGKELRDEEWLKFLDDAWDDSKWEEEMSKRFGDDYYAIDNEELQSDDDEDDDGEGNKKKRLKKPKWDDDIDIKDIVSDFDEGVEKPQIILSEQEDNEANGEKADQDEDDEDESRPSKKRKTSEHKRVRLESQKKVRQERAKLEALVDSKLELTHHDLLSGASSAGFRYRETEPQSFGMTARDILLAPSDAHLNEYAGLKKLAHFRHPEKKARDAHHLSKKKRLRQWRRDVFGKEFEREGPTYGFERLAEAEPDAAEGASSARILPQEQGESNIVGDVGGSRKKRKRSKGKKKAGEVEAS
ncbi:Kinetochore protein Spc24 [Amphichorda felina]